MSHCYECGGRGISGGCSECGKDTVKMNLSRLEPTTVGEVLTKARGVAIPEEYVGVEWSKVQFLRSKPRIDITLNRRMEMFLNNLQLIHDFFAKGLLPNKGAIIIAPSTYGKEVFAFSCMQHALKHGYTVGPLLDTIELKRMLILSGENVHYKLDKVWSYDDYITSDVLFVTASKTDYVKGSFMVLQELLSRRSRKGLPTFIISRYTIEEMSMWDKTGDFRKIATPWQTDNMKKYPKIIMYKEVMGSVDERD